MRYLENKTYRNDIETAIAHTIGFDNFRRKRILILGASGLIGSFITDCFLYANENLNAGSSIYAASRNREHLQARFGKESEGEKGNIHFLEADVTVMRIEQSFDHIIHAAGYGHPAAFRKNPVEVLLSNVMGTCKVLETARCNPNCRVLYISSGEVQEEVDHLSARACYPVGKKAAETLCISYMQEYGSDIVIARPCHTFGANVTEYDNRATAQFLAAAAMGADIKMYSEGEQVRSFSYVADCVSGLLTVLSRGEKGREYGVSSGESCMLREFAGKCAEIGRCRVEMHVPTREEAAEISPITCQIVNNDALKNLGWHPAFSIEEGIRRSIQIMREAAVGAAGTAR